MGYQQLLKEYQQAVNNFNNADADHIEAAILAEIKLESYLAEIKLEAYLIEKKEAY